MNPKQRILHNTVLRRVQFGLMITTDKHRVQATKALLVLKHNRLFLLRGRQLFLSLKSTGGNKACYEVESPRGCQSCPPEDIQGKKAGGGPLAEQSMAPLLLQRWHEAKSIGKKHGGSTPPFRYNDMGNTKMVGLIGLLRLQCRSDFVVPHPLEHLMLTFFEVISLRIIHKLSVVDQIVVL